MNVRYRIMRARAAAKRFATDSSGTMTVFALFMLIVFFVVGGLAIDFMRFEERRVRLQHTIDRAVLAAADLDQGLDATNVVLDYFAKAGLAGTIEADDITPVIQANCRDVTAVAELDMPTFFLHMVDIDSLGVPASARAAECVTNLEISLVLDTSNSMNDYSRLTNLQTAAKQFVSDIIPDPEYDDQGNPIDNPDRVSISIVPFASQVNLGTDLGSHFNLTTEHNFSHCVRFADTDFSTVAVDDLTQLQREGHFNRWEYNMFGYDYDWDGYRSMDSELYECIPNANRQVLPWEASETVLHSYIDALTAEGNTSIDIGAKWGAALLDPTLRDVVTARTTATPAKTDSDFAGRPVDYGTNGTLKVLVVMSDGANTDQAYLTSGYMTGGSEVWLDENSSTTYSDDEYSHYDLYYGEDWWWHYDRRNNYYGPWKTYPDEDNAGEAYELTWHELFNRVTVEAWSKRIYNWFNDADDNPVGQWDGYNDAIDYVTGATKDTRLTDMCAAAKNAGILIFTIRFEITANSSEDQLLKACATLPSYSYNPTGTDLSAAFSSIETTINELRLIH